MKWVNRKNPRPRRLHMSTRQQTQDSAADRALVELIFGQGRTLNAPLPIGSFVIGELHISRLHLVAAAVSCGG